MNQVNVTITLPPKVIAFFEVAAKRASRQLGRPVSRSAMMRAVLEAHVQSAVSNNKTPAAA